MLAGRVGRKVNRKKSPYKTFVFGGMTITKSAEVANVITVTGQLIDDNGQNVATVAALDLYVSGAVGGTAIIGTAPSGGLAATTGAVLASLVANKYLKVATDATGKIVITVTEVGIFTFYLVFVMPDGSLVISPAITFA